MKVPTMSVHIDERKRIVVVEGSGLWDMDLFVKYSPVLADCIAKARSRYQRVLVLGDFGAIDIIPAEVATQMAQWSKDTYRAGDSAAIVLSSSLGKLQIKRILNNAHTEFFDSRVQAEHWLQSRPV